MYVSCMHSGSMLRREMRVPYGLDEVQPAGGALPALKPEDAQYFGKLFTDVQVC